MWRARLRSSGGFGTVGLAVAVVAATSLALAGVGAERTGLLFGSGFAWLGSDEENEALLVNGATGQGTSKVDLGPDGVRLDVQMFGDHAYVVQVTGDGSRILYRLDDATLEAGTKRRIGAGQTIARSAERAWLVDDGAGTVEPVDPETLAPGGGDGGQGFRFTAPIRHTVDGEGRLVVVEDPTATAYVVTDTRGAGMRVGDPGDRLESSAVDDRPVIVNLTAPAVHVLDSGVPATVPLPAGPGSLEVAPQGEGGVLVLLRRDGARGELVIVDLDEREVRPPVPLADPVPPGASVPYSTGDAVFLVDAAGGAVLVIDPATGRARTVPLDIPRGSQPVVFVKDGRLWVNDAGGEKAVVVESDGRHHDIDKYDRGVPQVDPAVAPRAPAPAPRSDPRPDPRPEGRGAPPSDPAPEGSAGLGAPGTPGAPGPGPAGPPAPPPAVAGAPGPPAQFSATAGDARVTLTWKAGNDGGSPLTGYTLGCTPDCGDGAREVAVPVGETHEVTGLTNGTTYRFELKAASALGQSPPARAQARPTADVPPAPSDVEAKANPDGTVTVSWQADTGGLDLTGFAITATSGGTTRSFTAGASPFTTPADRVPYDADDVPDTTFTVAARAGGTQGPASPPSNPVDPFNKPAFAGAQINAQAGAGKVQLDWPAARGNGREVTYEVERCRGASCTAVYTGPDRSATAGGLTNGTAYTFRVTPSNDAGEGPAITSAEVVPVGKPVVTLSNVKATSSTAISATVAVEWNGDTGTCAVASGTPGSVNCGAGTYTASGLKASTSYNVRVCATNGAGQSCSATQAVKTPAPPGKQVVVDGSRWLGLTPPHATCGSVDGVSALKSPQDKNVRTRCIPNGQKETLTCQVQGAQLQSDFGQGRQVFTKWWFKTSKGDYVSAMWIQESSVDPDQLPAKLGLPNC